MRPESKPGMVLHGPEKLSLNLAQRVLPLGSKKFDARPPVSNTPSNYIGRAGHIGKNTLLFQMMYNKTGGLIEDGEMCSIPSCKSCGMPQFTAIYYLYCMTQVASHSTPFHMNYDGLSRYTSQKKWFKRRYAKYGFNSGCFG